MSLFVAKPSVKQSTVAGPRMASRAGAKAQTAAKPAPRTLPKRAKHSVPGTGRIVNRELAPFSRQLSSLLNAGMSLIVSLSTLEEQAAFIPFRNLLKSIRMGVESGSPFSEALSAYPRVFDNLFTSIVRAGERSGEFAVTMRQLGDLLEATARLRRKVRSAISYPIVVLSLAITIATGLITFVVPVFSDMFAEFGADLPGPTKFLMTLSSFMRHNFIWILAALAIGAVFFVKWKKTEAGARAVDALILRLPVFGTLVQKTCIARVSRILALMMKSGVPILDALEIVASASGNQIIGSALLDARTTVEQGNPLAQGLDNKPCIPTLMVRMLAAGEKSGQIDAMCLNIADTYDDEVETMITGLTSLLEPMLMVFLGVIIGGIVVCLFLPIFKLATIVG